MRTITFEVEVDDEIIQSLSPSIFDDVFKQAADGRLFLCKAKTSVVKKLVRLHRDVEEGGKEAPWFENIFLPDDMRIVGMSGGNAGEYVDDGSELVAQLREQIRQELFAKQHSDDGNATEDDAARLISTYTLHDDHRQMLENNCALINALEVIKETMKCIAENQSANCNLMLGKHEELLKHFKQVHQEHLEDCTHFAEFEKRLMKRIHEGSLHAANTANTVGHDILRALPELEDRIKEYIGEPDPAQSSLAGNAPSGDGSNQALLRALDLLATVIKK